MMRIPIALVGLVALACGGSAASTVAIPTTTQAPVSTIANTPTLAPTMIPTIMPTLAQTRTTVPTPTVPPVATTVAPTDEPPVTTRADAVTERVEDVLALASSGNWLEAWEFYTLSFRDSCPKETFASQARTGMAILRMMTNVPLGDSLEFRLMSVTVEGDTALVGTRIYHQGEPLEYGAQDELDSWTLIDGEWWNNVPPGPEGCVN